MAEVPPVPPPAPQPEHQTLVLTDPPPEKHHAMLWGLCVAAVALVTGGIVYAYWQINVPSTDVPAVVIEQEESATTTSQTEIFELALTNLDGSITQVSLSSEDYLFEELHSTSTKTLFCPHMKGTDPTCSVILADRVEKEGRILGFVDFTDKAILFSPNEKNILIALEDRLVLLDTGTLSPSILFQAEQGTALGTYSGYPFFYPSVRWVDSNRIEVSIFEAGTQGDIGPAPTPLEVKILEI